MALDPVKNFAKVDVSTGYDASATSVVLTAGGAAKLPDPSSAGAFNLVWWNSTDHPDPSDDANVEIVRVTSISSETLTVSRGQEGVTATTKNTASKDYKMILAPTKKTIDDIFPVAVSDLATGTDGELITWDGAGNPAVVAVGSADQVLTSNGAGAAPTFQDAGGGGVVPRFKVRMTSTQAVTLNVINFDNVVIDTESDFNTTLKRWVASVAGDYQVNCRISSQSAVASAKYFDGTIRKNGSAIERVSANISATHYPVLSFSTLVTMGVGDYLDLYISTNNGTTTLNSGARTDFSGFLIAAA